MKEQVNPYGYSTNVDVHKLINLKGYGKANIFVKASGLWNEEKETQNEIFNRKKTYTSRINSG